MSKTLANVALELLRDETLSSGTRRRYESILLPFVGRFGRLPIESVTREQLENYLGEGRSVVTKR